MAWFRRGKTPAPAAHEERATIDAIAAMARNSSASYSWSGASVTLDSALKSAAAWACITRLKSTATSLPVDVIRASPGKRVVLPKSSQPELIRTPSGLVSRRAWIGQVVHSLTTSGNAYGDVVRADGAGRPLQIEIINSSRVRMTGNEFLVDGRPRTRWPEGDLWHVAASHLMVDGSPVAMSPVDYGRESIATGMSAERYGANFFKAGGVPVSVLTPSGANVSPTQEQAEQAKQAVIRATENRGVLALGGWDLTPFNINPKDTQFLELLEFTVLDACRRWMVPPGMIYAAMSGQNVTYANVSDADLAYLKHSVASWLVDLEDSWAEMLPGNLTAKFEVDAVLRMDVKSRTDVHKTRLEMKTRTINEVRRLEDEDPFDDPIYDEPGIPADGLDPVPADPMPDIPDPKDLMP